MDGEAEDRDLDDVLAAAREEEDEPPGMLLAQAQIAGKLFGEAAPGLGRFRVLSRLGGGGMGVVYAAYDPELDRGVALKTVHVPSASTDIALGEAKALARLSHPNVVPVFDVGVAAGHVYIVMELVRGETLRAAVAGKPLHAVLDLYRQAGLALAAAHDAGLVHRDFKPENALVGTDGRVRVVDFGLACETASGRTKAGTPRYMPPESEITPAADQYSFGVALREAVPDPCPGWVHAVIERATARDPAARFPSMHELLRELARDPARVRRQRVIAAAVVLALAAVGATAFVVGRGGAASDPIATACTGAASELDAAWPPAATQTAIARIATLSPYGQELAPLLEAQLAEHRTRWIANHEAACFAHHRGEQSDALFDRRMACLDRSRAGRAAVGDLSTNATAEALPGLAKAVRALPEPSSCADLAALLAGVEPPAPAIAGQVAEVRRTLERARIDLAAGQGDEAATLAARASARAYDLAYPPLIGESWLVEGHARMFDEVPDLALFRLDEAQTIALAVGDLSTGLEAWARAAWLRATRGRPFEGASVMTALAPRTTPFARALMHNNLGGLALARGDRATARRELEAALVDARNVSGPGALELVNIRVTLAAAIDDPSRLSTLMREAEDEIIRLLGRDHPDALQVRLMRLNVVPMPDADLARQLGALCPRTEIHKHGTRPARCWRELAYVRDALGDRSGALDALDHALAFRPIEQQTLSEGYVYWWRGDLVRARAKFETALAELPPRPREPFFVTFARAEILLGSAELHAAVHDSAAARRAIDAAIAALVQVERDHPGAIVDRRRARAYKVLAQLTAGR